MILSKTFLITFQFLSVIQCSPYYQNYYHQHNQVDRQSVDQQSLLSQHLLPVLAIGFFTGIFNSLGDPYSSTISFCKSGFHQLQFEIVLLHFFQELISVILVKIIV